MTDVYLITSPNGKQYIGISSAGFQTRWKKHCEEARRTQARLLCKAIRKYGPESFRVELIEQCETWEQACAQERFWIQYVGTKQPWGYNLTDGGEGTLGREQTSAEIAKRASSMRGQKRTPDQIERLAAGQRGRKMTPESIAKSVSTRKARGYVHSEETRAKMRKTWAAKRELT